MKKFGVTLLLFLSVAGQAQRRVSLDLHQAPAEELFRQIEHQSGYRIYAPAETDTLRFTLRCTQELPATALQKAFEGTSFRVSTYRDQYLFVLKDKELITLLAEDYFKATPQLRQEIGGLSESAGQKANSENKLYLVGRPGLEDAPGVVTLSGTVTDFTTGEPLAGVVIYTQRDSLATTSDASGSYELRFPAGRQDLLIRGVGLRNTRRQVAVYESGRLDMELEEEVYALGEITVRSERLTGVQAATLGVERIEIKDMKNIPTAFGETDVIKVVMMLPGVKAVGEASGGINVRGGSTDQNLILFNEGTIYNPTHLFGFFSAFNPDLIQDIELYKSSIPARYGGRISSVLDLHSREESRGEGFSGSASLGLLTGSLTLEGPLGEQTTYILGGRTTYSDWLLGMLPQSSEYRNGSAGFYDLNAVVGHRPGDRDHLLLSGYYSRDRFSLDEAAGRYAYANTNVSVRWKHFFSEELLAAFTVGYDRYGYETSSAPNPTSAYRLSFDINQAFGKADFTFYPNNRHRLDFGGGLVSFLLNPGTYLPDGGESLVIADRIAVESATETSVYVSDRWEATPAISVDAGMRYGLYHNAGTVYGAPDFRLSFRYAFAPGYSFKAGVNTLQQNIHKLSNTAILSPTDTWKLSNAHIRPQWGMQAASGFYGNFGAIETSVEGYYKAIRHYLDYRSGARLVMNHHIETDVMAVEGRAWGVELTARKPEGKLNGWIGYAYSRTELHGERWYAADYDKPHELKLVGNYKFTQRYSLSFNCDYATGRPVTLPSSKYAYAGGEFVYYSDRNRYRIPDFFRMDLSLTIEPTHHLKALTHSTVSIGVYNLTGRKNAYSVYYLAQEGKLKGYKMAIFGAPIPYLSYNIKF
jgi:hypothetical protein